MFRDHQKKGPPSSTVPKAAATTPVVVTRALLSQWGYSIAAHLQCCRSRSPTDVPLLELPQLVRWGDLLDSMAMKAVQQSVLPRIACGQRLYHHHTPPPPLRKHRENEENDGQTRSWCLDKAVLASRSTKRIYVTENLPIPHPKHSCRNRALEHSVQAVLSKFWRSSLPIRGIRSMNVGGTTTCRRTPLCW